MDDGSTDGTRVVAESFAARDPRVRVLHGEGAGIVPALEMARGQAVGEYLARMDGDDVALPNRFARQLDLMEGREDVILCGTGVRYVPDAAVRGGARRYEAWLNGLDTPEELAVARFVECPLAHPTWMMRRMAVEVVGGYRDHGWPEDYDLFHRLAELPGRIVRTPGVEFLWREHPSRLSRQDDRYSSEAFVRCRVHYLRRWFHDKDGVVICGAGPTGKAFSRAWQEAGGRIRAFVEVDPRKLGQEIHGAPVVQASEIRNFPGALVVGSVGQEGARAELRRQLRAQGLEEGRDFVAVA